MRVAYLVNKYPAPSHSFIRREILALEGQGVEVVRFTIRAPPADLPDPEDQRERTRTEVILSAGLAALIGAVILRLLTRPGATLNALGCTLFMARRGGGWIRHIAYWVEACWLVRRLDAVKAAHLHAHFGTNPAAVARLVRRLGGPPYSFTVHGPDEFDAPIALDLAGKIAEAAAAVAISDYGRGQLMRWAAPECWSRIAVVRCGLGRDFLAAGADGDAPAPPSDHLCCVARLSAQKGLPLLIAAMGRLRDQGVAARLTLVGDGELRAWLEQEVARLDLGDRIHFAGLLSANDVRAALRANAIFVLPSFAEGLPVVLMEALASERPVLTTAIAGIPELVDNQCGWLIPSGSVDALVEGLKRALATTRDERLAMASIGAARVRAAHDIDRNAAAMRDIFLKAATIEGQWRARDESRVVTA